MAIIVVDEEMEGMNIDSQKERMMNDGLFQSSLMSTIKGKFQEAEDARKSDEKRWLTAYENYRGLYPKNVKFRENEKSRVFIGITKTKVTASYGQLTDVIFSQGKFPISCTETKVPEGVSDKVFLKEEEVTPLEGVGYTGDGYELTNGKLELSSLQDKFTNKEGDVIVEGEGNPTQPTFNPAKIAAKNMEKLIHDQIEESDGVGELRSAIFEQCLLGTGIIKGPFNYTKIKHSWDKDDSGKRTYKPTYTKVPKLEFVSIWDFYPDPNATSMSDTEWVIQRHKLNRQQLRNLKNMPYFNEEALDKCLTQGSNYQSKDYESSLKVANNDTNFSTLEDRYEVLEYWGVIDSKFVKEAGLDDSILSTLDGVQVNCWVCDNEILRVVLNPFTPERLPYQVFPYERNPYSIFGVGVAENMVDSQMIMNGHARMAIDNLALAGNLVFDIDESALVGGQSMEIYSGKIFKRQAGMPGQSIYGIKFPNTAQENMMMFDKFRQLSDEETGIPSYSHGQTGVSSMTRTASGMSMLMGAASLNVKTVVKNLDDFLLKPLGNAFFQWNMSNYEGPLNVEGDLEIKAMGVASLMQQEVRSQRLTQFLQVAANPAIAPLLKMPTLIKELAISMDLDPEELLNNQEEALLYAKVMGEMGASGQQPPQEEAQQTLLPAMPNEEGFSGTIDAPTNTQ